MSEQELPPGPFRRAAGRSAWGVLSEELDRRFILDRAIEGLKEALKRRLARDKRDS